MTAFCCVSGDKEEAEEQGEKKAMEEDKQGDGREDLHQLFQHDLELIRSKLSSDAAASPTLSSPPLSHQPSVGHRSGFDAFMTGYSLLSFALRKLGKAAEPVQLLDGLKDWANCLALRGKDIPLRIAKSHFVNTSVEHQRNAERFGMRAEH